MQGILPSASRWYGHDKLHSTWTSTCIIGTALFVLCYLLLSFSSQYHPNFKENTTEMPPKATTTRAADVEHALFKAILMNLKSKPDVSVGCVSYFQDMLMV